MLKFPKIENVKEPPLPRMSLVEYGVFCEQCLRANSVITAENCMKKRTDEARMKPFKVH